MQLAHTHKAVTGRVEAKKLLSGPRKLDYREIIDPALYVTLFRKTKKGGAAPPGYILYPIKSVLINYLILFQGGHTMTPLPGATPLKPGSCVSLML